MRDLLAAGLDELAIAATEQQIEALLCYLELLKKWNKTHNLTAITDSQEMVTLHLLDSLSVLPYVNGPKVLDVGSGAGLPGLVLAIMLPDVTFVSVDARSKKIQFQMLAAAQLKLQNFQAVHTRVEEMRSDVVFSQIISRAFSSLFNFTELTQHVIAPQGQWLAMKGQYPDAELEELQRLNNRKPNRVEKLQLPGFNGERHLIIFDT